MKKLLMLLYILLVLLLPACAARPSSDPLWLEQHEAERAEYWPLWYQACLNAHRVVIREDALHVCPIGESNCLPDRTDWDFGWRTDPRTGEQKVFFKTRHVYCSRTL